MINCPSCNFSVREHAKFCENCGTRLVGFIQSPNEAAKPFADNPDISPDADDQSTVTVREQTDPDALITDRSAEPDNVTTNNNGHATLTIERGDSPGTVFYLRQEEILIGRWDADNGIFPDVDLDAHDSDAKVSRRHARIYRSGVTYFIEDLGSTNGTYVNRGRRLLPGTPHLLNDGDEIIVGKTFLRFQVLENH
jgi:serine/threonine-protein kinase